MSASTAQVLHQHDTVQHVMAMQNTDERQRRAEYSGTARNLLQSVVLIFSIKESTSLRSHENFMNTFVIFLVATVFFMYAEIYTRNHVLLKHNLKPRLLFEVLLDVITIFKSYFTYLLVSLVRDQISTDVADVSWTGLNLLPLVVIAILFLSMNKLLEHLAATRMKLD